MKIYGDRKTRVGRVVSNKMNQTAVVAIDRLFKERMYKKYIRKTKKVYAHDADDSMNIGDKVRIVETQPMSKTKRWMILEVIERAK